MTAVHTLNIHNVFKDASAAEVLKHLQEAGRKVNLGLADLVWPVFKGGSQPTNFVVLATATAAMRPL